MTPLERVLVDTVIIVKSITNSSDGRSEAQAWLAGQLAWERVLVGLRDSEHDRVVDDRVEPVQRPAAA